MKKLIAKIERSTEETDALPWDNKQNFIMIGGDSSNPTWKEYLEYFDKEMQEMLRAIKVCLIKSKYFQEKANNCCNNIHFKLSNGKRVAFTWRAWGDLNQAIVGKREGYMTYYM